MRRRARAERPKRATRRNAAAPAAPEAAPKRRGGAVIWTSLVLVVAAGLIVLLVMPTRTWLTQKHQIAAADHKLAQVNAANDKLQARVDAVATKAEVERVAREQYGYSRPGEVVFSMSPSPAPAVPDTWPYRLVLDIVTVRGAAGAGAPSPSTTAGG